MSVPLDRLYHFLYDHCDRDVIIYHFFPHGSKKPENVSPLLPNKDTGLADSYLNIPVLFHDQEPLSFNDWGLIPNGFKIPGHPYSKLKVRTNRFNLYDKPILVHSELNSREVEKFEQDGAIPAYYWSHAVIARDWFRYAEHDQQLGVKDIKKKFLIYNRAWKGTREYRLKFADLLVQHNIQDQCITSFNPTDGNEHYTQHCFDNPTLVPSRTDLENFFPLNAAPSWASADYVAADYQSTEIEVILETMFDDTRWHITEKALRALAVAQPFILCSTPGSLKYLRSYGFETFGQCWDESYDDIQDPAQRLEAIVALMKSVSNDSLELARRIAKRNQQHFFSATFMDSVMSEFKTNLATAVTEAKKYKSGVYFVRQSNISASIRNIAPKEVFDCVENLPSQD